MLHRTLPARVPRQHWLCFIYSATAGWSTELGRPEAEKALFEYLCIQLTFSILNDLPRLQRVFAAFAAATP
jgi:hypothetical protein